MESTGSFASALQLRALLLTLIGFCGSGWSLAACIEQERIGLMKLKAAFTFPDGSSSLPPWDGHESNCCRWTGVKCSKTSMRVTELHLSQTRDVGRGPWCLNASLFLPFDELEVLELGANQLTAITGTLRLKRLRVLDLHRNELAQLPSLDMLPSLNELHLQLNGLKNLSPLEGLKLKVLDVSFNSLDGDGLSVIWSMTSLRALSLAKNQLNNSIFQGLCQLTNLEELNAIDNLFIGSIPPCLYNLTALRALDLQHNVFTGSIPSALFHRLKSLKYVSLSGNAFEGSFSFAALANSSRLEVFDLVNNYHRLNITSENAPYISSAQFKIFRLSGCALNEPHGVIPSFLQEQHDLRLLELNHNNMRGDFPSWLLMNNTKLEVLKLMDNSLSGSFSLNSSTSKNFDMRLIDVSSNYIDGELPISIGSFFPNLAFINMSRNLLRGEIPSSFGDMNSLSLLDLSDNHFTGELPPLLLNKCQNLRSLKLSNNNLHGRILPRTANLTKLYSLSLDNNRFTGEISPGLLHSRDLHILDLSSNILSGAVPGWIGDFEHLEYVMLTNNSLEGPLPLRFCRLNLRLLCISGNSFGPTVPSCANVSKMVHLSFQNNHLIGPFPEFLSTASSIVTLDLRDNGLSGPLPTWIGSFSELRALLLKGNNFEGLIPHQLCQVNNMSIMDLSDNNLSGAIPSCLNDLAFGNVRVMKSFSTLYASREGVGMRYEMNSMVLFFVASDVENVYLDDQLVEVKFVAKSRLETYRGNILEYMSGLDLSSNQLNGSIPPEIGYLNDLLIMNLSNNHLIGPIPSTFSRLKQIESLDLSHNQLSGAIPPQLTELIFLSIFSLAYNNLSGQTPEMKNQFATFDWRSYEGNIFLCGPPLESCHNSGPSSPAPPHPDQKDDDDLNLRDYFLWGFAGAYLMSFLGTFTFLYIRRPPQ